MDAAGKGQANGIEGRKHLLGDLIEFNAVEVGNRVHRCTHLWSVNHAGECAPAHEKRRIRTLLGQIDESLHQIFVEVLAGGVARPGLNGDLGHFKVVLEGEATQHRQAPE